MNEKKEYMKTFRAHCTLYSVALAPHRTSLHITVRSVASSSSFFISRFSLFFLYSFIIIIVADVLSLLNYSAGFVLKRD